MNFKEMTIQEIAKEIHRNAVEKGFWENPVDFETQIALFHSEVSEAFESWRRDERPLFFRCNYIEELKCALTDCNLCGYGKLRKPEGWAVELIDLMIRILDYFEGNGYTAVFAYNESVAYSNNLNKFISQLHLQISDSFMNQNREYLYGAFLMARDFLKDNNLDCLKIMQLKHEYNCNRPKLHGKRF